MRDSNTRQTINVIVLFRWFQIPSMINRRYEGSSVVDENDNLWVIGGTHDSKGSGLN